MLDQILSVISSASGQAGIIAVVVEAVLRLVKSDKPLSILHVVALALHKIGDISAGIANLLDKVLPQNLK